MRSMCPARSMSQRQMCSAGAQVVNVARRKEARHKKKKEKVGEGWLSRLKANLCAELGRNATR